MGKYKESEKYLKIACNLDGGNIWSWYYYGLLMKKLNNDKESEIALNRSLNMFDKNCNNNYKNAILLFQTMKPHLYKTKGIDTNNALFHDRLFQQIEDKIASYLLKDEDVNISSNTQ